LFDRVSSFNLTRQTRTRPWKTNASPYAYSCTHPCSYSFFDTHACSYTYSYTLTYATHGYACVGRAQ